MAEQSTTSRLPFTPTSLPKIFPRLKSSIKSTFSSTESAQIQVDNASDEETRPVQQMELEDSHEPPEGAQVFTTPSVRQVKGKMISTNFAIFFAGMNDAATGALIPYLQPAYDIGLLFVALVYLVNFAGWLVAAFTNVHLTSRFGTGGVLVIGATSQLFAYILIFWKPPFPLYCLSFFFSGLGVAYQDAQSNTFIANVNNAHRWLGLLHAAYGLGALIAPLVATAIAVNTPYWHYYYLVTLGLGVFNLGLLAWTFREGLFKPVVGARETANKDLKATLSNRAVWILSGFFFLYVGAEVTAGGWVVQFLITVRKGEPSKVGYVASGFWGGLTLGRLVLADITHKLGERRMIFVYLTLALVMQLLFWFVPNIIANAVVLSLLGFFIAPFFPVGLSVLTKLLPRELHVGGIGFSATVGQAGSAAFPFLTGAIASKAGVKVLQPIMVGLLAGMAVLWALMPRVKRPTQ